MTGTKRLLIVGAGDVAQRMARRLAGRYRLMALVRCREDVDVWHALGATPIIGDLDTFRSLRRLAGIADFVVHCAPPPAEGETDTRTRHLLAALNRGQSLARSLVYISTTGVYGDCAGACVDETRTLNATTGRARRRVSAERMLRSFGVRTGVRVAVLRAPGIYAADRLPFDRLRRADPVLRSQDDVFTNHIHAEDLAVVTIRALTRAAPGRVYNVTDDSRLPMGDYHDLVADSFGLPRPPRLSRAQCAARVSPQALSFMTESRCVSNLRMKRELRVRLQYPTVFAGLAAAQTSKEN